MAKGDIDKQNALLIASCALTHCAAQFKEDSPEYDVWHDLEKLGASDEYAEYRTQLQDKARELALSDAEFEENIHLLFDYDTADYLSDKSKKHDVPVRAEGLLQAAGGAATIVVGGVACETGAACVLGGTLWVTGSDNLIAGVNQIISGTPTKTVGAGILESIGVPAEYSELVYAGFDVATGMTSVIVKSIKTGQMRQVLLTKNGKTTQIVGNALKDFAASKQGSIKIPGTGAGKGTTGNVFEHLELSDRHLLDRLSIPKATGNSLFTGTKAEALSDLAEIKSGTAIKNGEFFTTSSGRVWGIHNNSVHPVSGAGVVNVSSQEYKVLAQAKKQGKDSAMNTLNHLEKNKILTSEQVERTKSILNLMKDKK